MQTSRGFLKAILAIVMLGLGLPQAGWAKDILTVEAGGVTRDYTAEQLMKMPQEVVVTKNNYVDSVTQFSGPSLKSILQQNGIGPNENIKLYALNDFSSVIPTSDAYKYNVILALLMNGKRMPIRDKGPIWVIYPMDQHPELQADIYNSRLVWQLRKIVLQ